MAWMSSSTPWLASGMASGVASLPSAEMMPAWSRPPQFQLAKRIELFPASPEVHPDSASRLLIFGLDPGNLRRASQKTWIRASYVSVQPAQAESTLLEL